jgi:Uma2 family endonuclease
MMTETQNYFDIVSRLPENADLIFQNVSWDDYEALLDQVGEASGLRISYDRGRLRVMTLSAEHENIERFVEALIHTIRLRFRIPIRSFGSMTMKRRKRSKGNEPDCCFYVQNAQAIGNKMHLDFNIDPPPDIAVEIDIHHDSIDKLEIYAGLGVPEVWRYDGYQMAIYHLLEDEYAIGDTSQALPMLSSAVLTDFLNRLKTEGEFQSLLAFDEWLKTQNK